MVSKGFPNVTTSGRQYNIGMKPSVILYTYINLHAGMFGCLQTPNSRKSLYLPNIPNSPLNRYGTMITNTCWSRNVRKNKIKSNINLPNFPISCQEISATCIFQIKNNQPLKKISHPKLRVLLDPPNVTLTQQY